MARHFCFIETERGAGGSTKDRERKIRCPECGWQPGRHDRWQCVCGHVWNTFETRGICPACDAAWRETQCLRCLAMSLHERWYGDSSPEG